MKNLTIQKVNPDEIDELLKVAKTSFIEAFSAQNSKQAMQSYLEDNLTKNKFDQQLLNTNSEFFFAKIDSDYAGYLKLNKNEAQTEKGFENSLEIERIYVLQRFQGYRVGKALLAKSIESAKEQNLNKIWLGVWQQNHKAIRFYEKNAFTMIGQHEFKFGDELQIDVIMQLINFE